MSQAESKNASVRPRADGLHAAFYEHCAAGKLHFQRCGACGRWRHMPRTHCPHCHSGEWQWAPSSGQGVVRSWTVCYRAFHPGVADDLPYAVAVVEFEPGARLVVRVDGIDPEAPDALRIGMPVAIDYLEIAPGCVVPRVRPTQ